MTAQTAVPSDNAELGNVSLTGKRILYLVPDLFGSPGGIARHGQAVCRALADVGASLSILALNDSGDNLSQAADLLPDATYAACMGNRAAFVRRAVAAVRRRPDLVLVEHANFSALGWLVARLSRVPLVVFVHGIEIWQPLSPLRQQAFRRADRVIAVSGFTMQKAASANRAIASQGRVLHNCLDPTFRIARAAHTPGPALSLLTVSRLSAAERYKGHDQIICSLPALLAEFPSLVYDVVGDGDLRPELERLAREQGVAHAVRFHGIVPEETLQEFYARASIFAMPSQKEGFGYVFVEAMAHGKPIVAGNRDATVEVVQDGKTGFLVDPEDIPSLTDRLAQLLRDRELRERMGARAIEAVRTAFSFEAFRPTLAGYLLDVLDEHRSARHIERL